jgi:hypothetical protein
MTDTTVATDKPPTDPRPPCGTCGSTAHTTNGHHESDEPTGSGGTSSPTGHHES